MTEIPSEIASSAAQSAFQAKEVAKERDARRAGQANTAERRTRMVDEAGSTVETQNEDVATFTDAEGSGSQGREEENQADTSEESPDTKKTDGIIRDDDGSLHVDLEA